MKIYLTLGTFIILFASACTGTKSTTDSSNNSITENTEEESKEEKVLAAGYKKCEILNLDGKDGCGFLLKDLNEDALYNPIDWSGKFATFRTVGNVVYVRLRPSKIAQTTCLISTPVMIDEMKLVKP